MADVSISRWKKSEEALTKARSALARVKESVTGVVPHVVGAAEVFVGAVGAGFLDGCYGTADATTGVMEHKIMGVPTNLGIGGVLVIGAAVGVAGKHSNHLWDLGKGFLAGYGVNLGLTLGYERKNSLSLNPGT